MLHILELCVRFHLQYGFHLKKIFEDIHYFFILTLSLKLVSLPANSSVEITSSFTHLSSHYPAETFYEYPGALFYTTFMVHTQLFSYREVI